MASLTQPLYFADLLGNLTLFSDLRNEEEFWYLLCSMSLHVTAKMTCFLSKCEQAEKGRKGL